MPQKLSKEAAEAKKKRDLAAANTRDREIKRADNQRKRRAAIKKHGPNWLIDKDYDHTKERFVSVKANRGNYGNGTRDT